jgi:lipid-A-disaccharide synthase
VDEWRTFLYPFGFLATLAFGARFIIQWLQSEKAQKSLVPRSFWQLSLLGNLLLMVHSFIQMQYHVYLVQVCNAVISWRNLNLMQTKRPPVPLKTMLLLLIGSILLTSLAFAFQDWLFMGEGDWFRIPTTPWQASSIGSVSLFWHILGTIAYLLFSSRFWIQWWLAERAHVSQLSVSFWWLSLLGALLSIAYFTRIDDSVNLIGPLIGIVPYVRNLMLIRKNKTSTQHT